MKTTSYLGILSYILVAIAGYLITGFDKLFALYVTFLTLVAIKFLWDNEKKS